MTELYTFEEALKALKNGKKITRKKYLDKLRDREKHYFVINTWAPRDWIEDDPERCLTEVTRIQQRSGFTLESIEATDWIILED